MGFFVVVRAIQEWGTEEVGQWLVCLGLGEYKEKFIANDIRGPELLHLGRTDLKVWLMFCLFVFFILSI